MENKETDLNNGIVDDSIFDDDETPSDDENNIEVALSIKPKDDDSEDDSGEKYLEVGDDDNLLDFGEDPDYDEDIDGDDYEDLDNF